MSYSQVVLKIVMTEIDSKMVVTRLLFKRKYMKVYIFGISVESAIGM